LNTGPFRLSEHDIARLGESGWLVREGMADEALCRAALADFTRLEAASELTPAAVGRAGQRRFDRDRRGDLTTWFTPDDPGAAAELPGLAACWRLFDEVRLEANRAAWLGLEELEMQVALYPGCGAGYVRHLDAFADRSAGRRLTAILYLNDGWRPEHGGALRLHLPDAPVDVEPLLGRGLLFLSERVEHEVLPAWAPRRAVTAWFRGAHGLPVR